MKKLVRLFTVATALLLLSSTAFAYVADVRSCQLVPVATYSPSLMGAFTTTVVGLRAASANQGVLPTSRMHWSFFNTSGAQLAFGSRQMGPNSFYGFVWSNEDTMNVAQGQNGILLFCFDFDNDNFIDNGGQYLGASTFYVDTSTMDVAYVPAVSLNAIFQTNINMWGTFPGPTIPSVGGASLATANREVTMQYAIDGMPNSGDDTTIYIFSDGGPGGLPNLGPTQTGTIFSDTGTSAAITFLTPQTCLNTIDVETIAGTGTFRSGFINWTLPAGLFSYAYVFTVIDSPGFGALQTLISMVGDP